MIHSGLRTLTIAIFPFLIYVFQLVGKASTTTSEITGILLLLNIIVELWQHRQQSCGVSPKPRPSSRRAPQKALAGCYLCEEVQVLRSYSFDGIRVGVCSRCYQNLRCPHWRIEGLENACV